MIAGRIIPAIATTTASVTGLVMLELYKLLQGRPVTDHRLGNFDLGTNYYTMFEPAEPVQVRTRTVIEYDEDMFCDVEKTTIAVPNPHTKWDKIWVENVATKTLGQLLDDLKSKIGHACYSASAWTDGRKRGVSLFNSLIPGTKANLTKNVLELLREKHVDFEGKHVLDCDVLTFNFQDEDFNEVETAAILLRL